MAALNGTFGGVKNAQQRRILKICGIIYVTTNKKMAKTEPLVFLVILDGPSGPMCVII